MACIETAIGFRRITYNSPSRVMKTFAATDWRGFPKSKALAPSLFDEIELVWAEWAHGLKQWSHVGSWPWFGLAAPGTAQAQKGRGSFDSRPPLFDGSGGGDEGPGLGFSRDVGFYHEPVMVREVLEALQPAPGKLIFDGTLGGGGHAEALLEMGVQVVAMDQDANAIRHASDRLKQYESRFCAMHGNFRRFPEILAETGVSGFDGMLVDLGVSSHQLDEADRGFSFMNDGPLDLRMDQQSTRTAADLVNTDSVEEIERVLREFGEEPQCRRIARAIVRAREKKPIQTTAELAKIVESAIGRKGKRHPATLTFQALRIAINDELAALHQFLELAPRWLKPGGRLAVISFHSLEDRIVKQTFNHLSTPFLDRPEWPEPRPNADFCMTLVNRKPLEPSEEEIKRNPRARSARLRVAQRLPNE